MYSITFHSKYQPNGKVAVTARTWECEVVYVSESNLSRAGSRLSPPENFGIHRFPLCKEWSKLGIMCTCQVREAIPQLAVLTELVLGDQGMSADARCVRALRKPFFFGFCYLKIKLIRFHSSPPTYS